MAAHPTFICNLIVIFVALPSTLILAAVLTVGFGHDGQLTYSWAGWQFSNGQFDGSLTTWGTDAIIAVICSSQGLMLILRQRQMSSLRLRATLLAFVYTGSTGFGALAHGFFGGRLGNTAAFRCGWSIVVLFTAWAGRIFGLIGNELMRTAPPC